MRNDPRVGNPRVERVVHADEHDPRDREYACRTKAPERNSNRGNRPYSPPTEARELRYACVAPRGRPDRLRRLGARPDARSSPEPAPRSTGASPGNGRRTPAGRPPENRQPTTLRPGAPAARHVGGPGAQAGMKPQDCPDSAVVVSAPPPDPRAVKTAHHPPGQTDVQHSLPGRHRDGRARSQRSASRATPLL